MSLPEWADQMRSLEQVGEVPPGARGGAGPLGVAEAGERPTGVGEGALEQGDARPRRGGGGRHAQPPAGTSSGPSSAGNPAIVKYAVSKKTVACRTSGPSRSSTCSWNGR